MGFWIDQGHHARIEGRRLAMACFLVLVAWVPPAAQAEDGALGEALLAEVNARRLEAGVESLELHPALTTVARRQVRAVSVRGETGSDPDIVPDTTRLLYKEGYAAHRWSEGTLIVGSAGTLLEQWQQVSPDFHRQMTEGDFENVGLAFGRYRGRPVVTMVLALTMRTAEWRQAKPLENLERVRALALETVNAVRIEQGRTPIRQNSQLDLAAQRHAEDMLRRAYYDHISPEGDRPSDRARAAEYARARSISENIAKGPFEPDEVVHRWMNSSGHRRNILRRGVTEMGFGVAFGENENGFEILWVQLFGAR